MTIEYLLRWRTGSPPQVRGKPAENKQSFFAVGITPAGAGKTTFMVVGTAGEEDHPRRCGENLYLFFAFCNCKGSPPQVRGKLYCVLPQAVGSRITPAGAGKTMVNGAKNHRQPDHPRRCGENRIDIFRQRVFCGSPPQVRGKRSRRRCPA